MFAPGTGYAPGDLVQIKQTGALHYAEFGVVSVISPTGAVDEFINVSNGFYRRDPGAICPTVPETGSGIGWELNCVWLPSGAVQAGAVKMITKGDHYEVGDQVTFGTDTYGPPLLIQVSAIHHLSGINPLQGEIREYIIIDRGAQTKTPPEYLKQKNTDGSGSGSTVKVTWTPITPPP